MNSLRHWWACLSKKGTNVYEDKNTHFLWFDEKDVQET